MTGFAISYQQRFIFIFWGARLGIQNRHAFVMLNSHLVGLWIFFFFFLDWATGKSDSFNLRAMGYIALACVLYQGANAIGP